MKQFPNYDVALVDPDGRTVLLIEKIGEGRMEAAVRVMAPGLLPNWRLEVHGERPDKED